MERRCGDRVTARMDIMMLEGNVLYQASLENISEKGMYITSRVKVSPAAMVAVSLQDRVMVAGNVVRVRKKMAHYGLGIKVHAGGGEYVEMVARLRKKSPVNA